MFQNSIRTGQGSHILLSQIYDSGWRLTPKGSTQKLPIGICTKPGYPHPASSAELSGPAGFPGHWEPLSFNLHYRFQFLRCFHRQVRCPISLDIGIFWGIIFIQKICFFNCSLHRKVALVSVTHKQSRLLQLVQTMEDQLIQQHVMSACIFYQFVESLLASFSRSEIRSSLALRDLSLIWFIRLDIRAFSWYCLLFLLLIVSHNPESLGSHKMMVLNVELSFCFAFVSSAFSLASRSRKTTTHLVCLSVSLSIPLKVTRGLPVQALMAAKSIRKRKCFL